MSAVCILSSVCILSLSAVHSLHFNWPSVFPKMWHTTGLNLQVFRRQHTLRVLKQDCKEKKQDSKLELFWLFPIFVSTILAYSCALLENTHTLLPTKGIWISWWGAGWGFPKTKTFQEIKLNWNFQRGRGWSWKKFLSGGGMDIFWKYTKKTNQCNQLPAFQHKHFCSLLIKANNTLTRQKVSWNLTCTLLLTPI